jgi:hypothetical protein
MLAAAFRVASEVRAAEATPGLSSHKATKMFVSMAVVMLSRCGRAFPVAID